MVYRESLAHLKTTNERVSGVVRIGKMKDGTIGESNRLLIACLATIPRKYRKTLTRDRGSENMGYREIETRLGMTCYFAHPF
jgi:IS30 family transposase